MKLEILSLSDALKYPPSDKTGMIRIFGGFTYFPPPLKKSSNWATIKEYSFDDQWPKEWKEYENFSELHSRGVLSKEEWEEYQRKFPLATEESMLSFFETRGQFEDRPTYFTHKHAQDILTTYETEWKDKIDTLIVHCSKGQNRAPALGIAMNEIYGWGIKGLKKQHPNYRRYVYEGMLGR